MKTTFILVTILLLSLVSRASAADRLENYTNKTVLIFTPHPDDDTFAVGGTMALLAKNKNRVVVERQLRSGNGFRAPGPHPQSRGGSLLRGAGHTQGKHHLAGTR
ncbi:MAG: hypothetical protein DME25_17995 [Verrucomicrobia bacterium]|nr:MAG: hypothetical protein DME25_17995 [Verrucomicrobiota bacterium]